MEYKNCKKLFRQVQRDTELKYELRNMEELTKCQEIDQRYFWKIVNKGKISSGSLCPIKLEDGRIVTEPEEICKA